MASVAPKSLNAGMPTAKTAVGKEAKAGSRGEAGDVSDEVSSVSSVGASVRQQKPGKELEEPQRYPINIHRRINALRHLYMDTRKKEHDLQIANFKREAETYKSLEKVWKKRLDIVTGKYEPTGEEAKFRLDDERSAGGNDPAEPPTAPDDGQLGVPKFWLVHFEHLFKYNIQNILSWLILLASSLFLDFYGQQRNTTNSLWCSKNTSQTTIAQPYWKELNAKNMCCYICISQKSHSRWISLWFLFEKSESLRFQWMKSQRLWSF